jgi:radical SAM protein with 4Fe4S-binding SPASM domain
MCFQVDKSFSGDRDFLGRMDLDLFKRVVDEARQENCYALTMASRGEPTLHPQLAEMLKYLMPTKEHSFFDLKLNTNATKLSEKLIHEILQSGVTNLVYSVDSDNADQYERIRVGGKFSEVLKNIKLFKKVRDKHYPNSNLITRVSGVLVENQSEKVIEDFWSEHVDEITLIRNLPRWDTYNNPTLDNENPCSLLWERMYVWFDGVVNPCDFDYKSKLMIGNLNQSTVKELWNSERFKELRLKHLNGFRHNVTPCDRCPI